MAIAIDQPRRNTGTPGELCSFQPALHRFASHRIVLSGHTQIDLVIPQRHAPASLGTR